MFCSPQNLTMEGPCKYVLNPYFTELYKTALLCRWKANLEFGTPFTCDIQTLFDDSSCFAGLPVFILRVLQVQLICDIITLLTPPPVFGGTEWDVTSGAPVVDQPTGGFVESQD